MIIHIQLLALSCARTNKNFISLINKLASQNFWL